MKINLLSPQNESVVQIVPEHQIDILSSLPKNNKQTDNQINWVNPITYEKDNSIPRHVIFTWSYEGNLSDVQKVDLYISENAQFCNSEMLHIDAVQSFLPVTNLKRNTKYYWKMAAFGQSGLLIESATNVFQTSDEIPQWYNIENTTNMRDIGGRINTQGYEIISGMLFRGAATDSQFELSDNGLSLLKNNLKIKTELDMRKPDDADDSARNYSINKYCFPIEAYSKLLSEESEKGKIAGIFHIFSNASSYPIYMHCIAGADRTGSIAVLLEAVLGLDFENIANDYELSSLSVFGMRSRYNFLFDNFIDSLMTYGNNLREAAENFLKTCGITENEIKMIRSILLAK